jgi:hypothetical protein
MQNILFCLSNALALRDFHHSVNDPLGFPPAPSVLPIWEKPFPRQVCPVCQHGVECVRQGIERAGTNFYFLFESGKSCLH